MYENGDKCPKCNEPAMPPRYPNATARMCQKCGHIEEFKKPEPVVEYRTDVLEIK